MNGRLSIFGDMDLLQVKGVSKRMGAGGGVTGVDFTQQSGQKIGLAGATGSGKSTLLKMIAGLVQPDAGEILFEGRPVPGPLETLIPGHREIAYLSQHFELWNNYKVKEILDYGNELSTEEAAALYEIGRIDHLLGRRTDQLSGGERQRIALVRLLVRLPRLLLLDEPFSNLDNVHKEMLRSVIRDIGQNLGISCILVSHDPQDVMSWADEILVLKAGRLVQKGAPERIYRHPVDEYTAGLFGRYNLLDPALTARIGRSAGADESGKSLLVRPEKLVLSAMGNSAALGKVTEVTFLGPYYEIEVEIAGARLLVRSEMNSFQAGQMVYLGLAP
jgi:ABC-type sugar transport system ATPase subunit